MQDSSKVIHSSFRIPMQLDEPHEIKPMSDGRFSSFTERNEDKKTASNAIDIQLYVIHVLSIRLPIHAFFLLHGIDLLRVFLYTRWWRCWTPRRHVGGIL